MRNDTNDFRSSCLRVRCSASALLLAVGFAVGCAETRPAPAAEIGGGVADAWTAGNMTSLASDGPVQGESGLSGAFGAAGGAAGGSSQAGGDGAEPEDGLAVHGSLVTRYVGRQSGGDQDHDVYALLALDLGTPGQDEWTGHILGRVSKDLDGGNGGDNSTFDGLEDTYDHSLNGRLYEAYVDGKVSGLEVLRLGRQTLYETPEFVRLDGARVESAVSGDDRHQFGVYAGRPVHEYESSPEGDEAFGAYAMDRPWKGARARLDYMHLQDDALLGTEQNDLWAVQLDQSVDEQLALHGDYTLLENAPRDYTVRGTWTDPEEGLIVQASHYELLSTQRVLVNEFDPFYETLIEYAPFRQERLLASKSFDEDFDLSGGADVRRVDESSDEGEFNREFERYHATGTWHGVFRPDVSLSLTGEAWNSTGSDVGTWGLDVTRVYSEDVRASVGSYYALFKNDFLLEQEREDVRTYYVTLRYRTDPRLTWLFGYEYEAADDDFQTLTVRASWRF